MSLQQEQKNQFYTSKTSCLHPIFYLFNVFGHLPSAYTFSIWHFCHQPEDSGQYLKKFWRSSWKGRTVRCDGRQASVALASHRLPCPSYYYKSWSYTLGANTFRSNVKSDELDKSMCWRFVRFPKESGSDFMCEQESSWPNPSAKRLLRVTKVLAWRPNRVQH